jgi:hypothetical protein
LKSVIFDEQYEGNFFIDTNNVNRGIAFLNFGDPPYLFKKHSSLGMAHV